MVEPASDPPAGAADAATHPPRAAEGSALPDALRASLFAQTLPLDPEPSYFSPRPLRLTAAPVASAAIAVADAAAAPPLPLAAPEYDAGLLYSQPLLDRPTYQRDLSSASTASNASSATVRPAPSLHRPRDRQTPYPDQSYAALHHQLHPAPHVPPIVRAHTSYPGHAATASVSNLPSSRRSPDHPSDMMDSGSRTVGHSPTASPGLFDPNRYVSTQWQQFDDGRYPSPWLHPTHRQPPKETNVADVQADPISGRKILNQYEIIDELGRGVHGKVKLGKNLETGQYVAIKIVDRYSKRPRLGKNASHEDKIKREIAILKKARHPNIVSLLEVIDEPGKKKVYIVLEHVELGEVKWRTEGAKEICLIEWRRFKREAQGVHHNETASAEDDKIMKSAHRKLAREHRRKMQQVHSHHQGSASNESWSLELGGESGDEYSETSKSSQASSQDDFHLSSHHQAGMPGKHEESMATAFRAITPTHNSQPEDDAASLQGSMYGAYDNDSVRGRTPSLAGSALSCSTIEDSFPEHFGYVPLMTIHAAWEAFKDTVLGIEYLHYQNVIHRDIKPANLLVTKEHRIKISDFGVSYLGRARADESTGDQSESEYQDVDEAIELAKTVGTPAFYAPELCRTEVDMETPKIDGSIDVWALGVTLYCLIYGRVPFHDTNAFTLMKVISEDEPHISNYRLKPVAEQASSRPSSTGRNAHPTNNARRATHDLEYEEVDDNLRDLLRRLLIKDPSQRITIPQIKRHPWVLSGISNQTSWMEETDPSRSFQGRKIEISKDDVEKAVVPLSIMERVVSTFKKTVFGRGSGSRRRAQSSATNTEPPPSISAASSSSTISQDGRRGSLAPGTILEALTRTREQDHPLAQSVSVTPEARERSKYFDSPHSRTASPAHNIDGHRPFLQDRSLSSKSPFRPLDVAQGRCASPSFPSALPGTPTALDSPGGSHLSGLFGGLPRRVVNSMRSKDKLRLPREHGRAKSIDKLGGDDDAHGVPSLAISTTLAAGHVNPPDLLKEQSPHARGPSPSLSEAYHTEALETSSRQSSVSSFASRLQQSWAIANGRDVGPVPDISSTIHQSNRQVSSPSSKSISDAHVGPPAAPRGGLSMEDNFKRAKEEFIKRRVREENYIRERASSTNQSRPLSSLSQTACPPSPDDDAFFQRRKVEEYLNRGGPSSESSPVGGQDRGLAFCSSEEQFATPISQSTSNPSIPSVASAGSSGPDDCAPLDRFTNFMPTTASADSFHINQFETPIDDPAGYDGDHPVESDDEDSDDDGGLFIGRNKSTRTLPRDISASNAETARIDVKNEILIRGRTTRSGSNGTVKKIPPPNDFIGDLGSDSTPH